MAGNNATGSCVCVLRFARETIPKADEYISARKFLEAAQNSKDPNIFYGMHPHFLESIHFLIISPLIQVCTSSSSSAIFDYEDLLLSSKVNQVECYYLLVTPRLARLIFSYYQANIARLTSAILTSYSLLGEERQEPEPVIYHPIPYDVHPDAIHFPQFV